MKATRDTHNKENEQEKRGRRMKKGRRKRTSLVLKP
jgi:hypothetical protein